MLNSRIQRESNIYRNRVIGLSEAKAIMVENIPNQDINLPVAYFLDHPFSQNLFEKYAYYLHFLIMFKSPSEVSSFLNQHYSLYGPYASKMFINFPIISIINGNIITPLMCAALWSCDPEMVRALCYWGADFSISDVHAKYPEEKYGTYYVNHINHLIAPNIFIIGMRVAKEFRDIIREIHYISQEVMPPQGWRHPGFFYENERLPTSPTSPKVMFPPRVNMVHSPNGAMNQPPKGAMNQPLTETIPEETSTD